MYRLRRRKLQWVHKLNWKWRAEYVWNEIESIIWRRRSRLGSEKYLRRINHKWGNSKLRVSIAGVYEMHWALSNDNPRKTKKDILSSQKSFKIGSKEEIIRIAHLTHTKLKFKAPFFYLTEVEGKKYPGPRAHLWTLVNLDH